MQMTPSLQVAIFNGAALANAVSAVIVLYFMQVVTASSGIRSWIALLQGVQRALYIVLCAASVSYTHLRRRLPRRLLYLLRHQHPCRSACKTLRHSKLR